VQEITREGDTYILRLPLPHVEMNKVLMTKRGDEMTIEIGNFKRDITLPTVLVNQEATNARFANKSLEIVFSLPAQQEDKSA
jgi:arsenite-transporting ATPase